MNDADDRGALVAGGYVAEATYGDDRTIRVASPDGPVDLCETAVALVPDGAPIWSVGIWQEPIKYTGPLAEELGGGV